MRGEGEREEQKSSRQGGSAQTGAHRTTSRAETPCRPHFARVLSLLQRAQRMER